MFLYRKRKRLKTKERIGTLVKKKLTNKRRNVDINNLINHVKNYEKKFVKLNVEKKIDYTTKYNRKKPYLHNTKINDFLKENSDYAHGPKKNTFESNSNCFFDYDPSICKDYKETGFCGYGNSCKFLHDRTDYKTGWQMEFEWKNIKKKEIDRLTKRSNSETNSDYEIIKKEEMPTSCYICREEFKDPIKTECKHYFCRNCAIKCYYKNPGCQICGEDTGGIFMAAVNLSSKMNVK